MSRNRFQRNQRSNTENAVQAASLEELQEQSIQQEETQEHADETEETTLDETDDVVEETQEDQETTVTEVDTPTVPEVTEHVFSDTTVNREEEQARLFRDGVSSRLTKQEVMNKVGLTARMSLEGIINYVATMTVFKNNYNILIENKDYVVNQGPRLQEGLFRNIMDIITKTNDADFRYSMDYLMQLFLEEGNDNKPLSFINLSRFQENLNLNRVEQVCYSNLMRTLTSLADPVTRKKNIDSEINLSRALEFGFSDAAKSRLIAYFTA